MVGFNSLDSEIPEGAYIAGDDWRATGAALASSLGEGAYKNVGVGPHELMPGNDPRVTGAMQNSPVTFSNAAYTVPYSATLVEQIGTMSAARTVTLPIAAQYPLGTPLVISDRSGTVTKFFKINIATNTNPVTAVQDSLMGATSNVAVISTPYGHVTLYSDGVSAWTRDFASSNITSVADASYTCLLSDRTISLDTVLTATRTITLPDATKYPGGVPLIIVDSGAVTSGGFGWAIGTTGGQNVNGGAGPTVTTQRAVMIFYSNGSNWKYDVSKLRVSSNLSDLASAATARANLGVSATWFGIAASDETTALATGTAKATFRVPIAFTLTTVHISATTAPTGAALIVNVKKNGTTVFSTKVQIDAGAKTSVGSGTPMALSTTAFAADDEVTVDIDQVGSTIAGTGLKVFLIGTL